MRHWKSIDRWNSFSLSFFHQKFFVWTRFRNFRISSIWSGKFSNEFRKRSARKESRARIGETAITHATSVAVFRKRKRSVLFPPTPFQWLIKSEILCRAHKINRVNVSEWISPALIQLKFAPIWKLTNPSVGRTSRFYLNWSRIT